MNRTPTPIWIKLLFAVGLTGLILIQILSCNAVRAEGQTQDLTPGECQNLKDLEKGATKMKAGEETRIYPNTEYLALEANSDKAFMDNMKAKEVLKYDEKGRQYFNQSHLDTCNGGGGSPAANPVPVKVEKPMFSPNDLREELLFALGGLGIVAVGGFFFFLTRRREPAEASYGGD